MTTTAKKTRSCALCEAANLPSICSVCVNYGLNEYGNDLRALKSKRDELKAKLTQALVDKGKADDQHNWRLLQYEKLAKLKERLQFHRDQVSKGRAKIEKISNDLTVEYELLESASNTLERIRVEQIENYYSNLIYAHSLSHMAIRSECLHKQSVVIKQICKLFPLRRVKIAGESNDNYNGEYDTICNARLPRGLDPHSVPSDELSASLSYMVQLLNLVIRCVGAPALHNSGFAGSCSRIWQRKSYWDARPLPGSEYPLFVPRENFGTADGETSSWSERSSSNFVIPSIAAASERKPPPPHRPDSSGGGCSLNFSSAASVHSVETQTDLKKGISLLKQSVACVTAYCHHSLSLEVPSDASTFEAFARLLSKLSSSKEVRSALSARTTSSYRCSKPGQQLYKSVWNAEDSSAVGSSTLVESAHDAFRRGGGGAFDNKYRLPSYGGSSYLYYGNDSVRKESNTIDEWDIVEHPTFPPPPSQTEDVEHWVRAMITDAKTK